MREIKKDFTVEEFVTETGRVLYKSKDWGLTDEEYDLIKIHPVTGYHILRGIYILMNNSYEVTKEQKREINILHDVTDG